jgi:hypothetical protein
MLYITCTQGNQIDSWLFVVGSQITNLTPDLSFGHNFVFQMFKWAMWAHFRHLSFNRFPMIQKIPRSNGFWPLQLHFEDLEVYRDSNSQHENSLGSVKVRSLTLFALARACDVTLGSFSWPATLQPPRLGCQPKARVATISLDIGSPKKAWKWMTTRWRRFWIENPLGRVDWQCHLDIFFHSTKVVIEANEMARHIGFVQCGHST